MHRSLAQQHVKPCVYIHKSFLRYLIISYNTLYSRLAYIASTGQLFS